MTTKTSLRSNFEPGSLREAVRRAQWKALGVSNEDMLKPKIAVVNSSSELAICFSHLDGIAKVVKDAIRGRGRIAVRDSYGGTERLHHQRRRRRRLHARQPRPHRQRHRDRGRRRAARRHDLSVVVRQDAAGASHGGGPLSLVEPGDLIAVDVDARALDLKVSDAELAARRARRGTPALPKTSGYLSIYRRTVQPMSTGAVLIETNPGRA